MPSSKLAGQVFGSLRAIEGTERRTHNGTIMWQCECLACGTVVIIPSTKLKSGEVQSCGCTMYIRKPRTERGHSGLNSLYHNYMNGAKRRNLEFTLTREEFRNLTQGLCTYCGAAPNSTCYGSRGKATEHGKYVYNGIDRLNALVGYIPSNCVSSCGECNIAKGTRTSEEFLNWINRVYKHNVR